MPNKSPHLLRICLIMLGLWPSPLLSTAIGCVRRLWNWCRGYGRLNAEDEKSYGALSFVVLSSILTCQIIDLADTFYGYLGKKNDAVFLISYLTCLPHLTVTLLYCLAGRLYISCVYDPAKHHTAVFSADYLTARLKYCDFGRLWWRFLGFMALPAACVILKFLVFLNNSGSEYCPRDAYAYIRTVGSVVGYVVYGCFCFVVHCLRLSHSHEFHITAVDISERGSDDIETTKVDIRAMCFNFRGYRNFVGMWMMMSVPLAVLGMVFMIPFTMDTLPEMRKQIPSEEMNLVLWTAYTWCNKTLFLLGPVAAVGGLDVGRPWRIFRESILRTWGTTPSHEHNKRGQDNVALEKLMWHMRLLKEKGSWVWPTLISSAISFYLATQLDPSQDLDPWIGAACRHY